MDTIRKWIVSGNRDSQFAEQKQIRLHTLIPYRKFVVYTVNFTVITQRLTISREISNDISIGWLFVFNEIWRNFRKKNLTVQIFCVMHYVNDFFQALLYRTTSPSCGPCCVGSANPITAKIVLCSNTM